MDDETDRLRKPAQGSAAGPFDIRAAGVDSDIIGRLRSNAEAFTANLEASLGSTLARDIGLVRGAPAGWEVPFDQLGVYRFSAAERAIQDEVERYESLRWGGLTRAQAEAAGLVGDIYRYDGMALEVEKAIGQARSLGAGPLAATIEALTSVGSLAPVASGLAFGDAAIAARIEALLTTASFGDTIGRSSQFLTRDYADLFPEMRLATDLEQQAVIDAMRAYDVLKPYPDWQAEALARIGAVDVAWVAVDDPDRSIEGMAKLAAMNQLVDHAPPADDDVVDTLRARLGDYRAVEVPAPATLTNPLVRVSFQIEQGFDPDFSSLPPVIAAAMLAPIRKGAAAQPVDEDALEIVFDRMMKRIEHALRHFIVEQLRRHHGDDWLRRVPGEPRRSWERKRHEDIRQGRAPSDLIHYADLDHHRRIIEQPDNWNEIFEPIFHKKEAIVESIRRLGVVRNPSGHFRAISIEDFIMLRGECAHLGRWLGIRWES